jgi:hypothetical protein
MAKRELVPGGLMYSRRHVRRRGGFVGIAISLTFFAIGWILRALLDGTIANVAWFTFTMIAFPVMPILGIPASGGGGRVLVAVLISALVWWFLGQLAAVRALSRPIVGWKEWMREFMFYSTGIVVGTIGGIALAAYLLGLL